MPGAHRIRDIAEQAGLSPATVDRVLHRRPGVSPRAVRQVEQALLDLDQQQSQLRLGARTLMLDVVVQAPGRFSSAVRQALEAELGSARPAAVRARFDLRESGDVADLVDGLDRVGGRGRTSHGVLLKAPDHPDVAAAVDRLAARGIPVVTLVTDVRDCARVAYVGLDNASAGETAAYLVDRWLGGRPGAVLATVSRSSFFGERERREAFVERLSQLAPQRTVVATGEADGLDASMRQVVREALAGRPDVVAVYSIGGGNRAIVDELARAGRSDVVVVAHDLDRDNVELLRRGAVSVVLHHDLHSDMRAAVRQVLRHHRLAPGAPTSVHATVEVVTPFNLPPRRAVR
ncbi:MAG TPA: LacI family DNA-binding transcriptional regulator [Segeticoccus sp.]|nr:LacI family DNA-binding transcriptional regulator [Segeticoccus sp.]